MTGLAAVGVRGVGKSATNVFIVVCPTGHIIATATNDANLVPGFYHAVRRIVQQLPHGRRVRSEELTQKKDAQFTFGLRRTLRLTDNRNRRSELEIDKLGVLAVKRQEQNDPDAINQWS